MEKPFLSIIIPAYRQEKTIVSDLKRIKKVIDNIRYSAEIICVVDGQVDETVDRAKKYADQFPNMHILSYPDNQGKGYAIKYGLSHSLGKIVGFIDAGMDINPNGLSMLLEHLEWYKADIVVGSKRHPASRVIYRWQRRVLSFGYQTLIRLFFGLNIRDTQVGLKLFRRPVIDTILPRLIVKRFAFDIEMLAVANRLGFNRIFEAPVEIKLDFGKNSTLTSKKFYRTVGNMLWDTLAVYYRLVILRYYDDANKENWLPPLTS